MCGSDQNHQNYKCIDCGCVVVSNDPTHWGSAFVIHSDDSVLAFLLNTKGCLLVAILMLLLTNKSLKHSNYDTNKTDNILKF